MDIDVESLACSRYYSVAYCLVLGYLLLATRLLIVLTIDTHWRACDGNSNASTRNVRFFSLLSSALFPSVWFFHLLCRPSSVLFFFSSLFFNRYSFVGRPSVCRPCRGRRCAPVRLPRRPAPPSSCPRFGVFFPRSKLRVRALGRVLFRSRRVQNYVCAR